MVDYTHSIIAMVPHGDIRPDQLRTELNDVLAGKVSNIHRYDDELTIETTSALSTAAQLLVPAVLTAHVPVIVSSGVGSDYGTDFHYVYDQTIYVTTVTTMTSRAAIACSALTGGTYMIEMSATYNGDSTKDSAIVQVFEGATPMGKSIRHEPKDTVGTEMGGSDSGVSAHVRHIRTYAPGATPTFSVQHASEKDGIQSGITDITLTILRVGD